MNNRFFGSLLNEAPPFFGQQPPPPLCDARAPTFLIRAVQPPTEKRHSSPRNSRARGILLFNSSRNRGPSVCEIHPAQNRDNPRRLGYATMTSKNSQSNNFIQQRYLSPHDFTSPTVWRSPHDEGSSIRNATSPRAANTAAVAMS